MNLYHIMIKKSMGSVDKFVVVAKNVTKAVEVMEKYGSKNLYSHEIVMLEFKEKVNLLQK